MLAPLVRRSPPRQSLGAFAIRTSPMPREAIIYGRIEGIAWRLAQLRVLQDRNAAVIAGLPETDDHPALIRGMFALPAPEPAGTYRQQVIHFGGSFEDAPADEDPRISNWLVKFEALLGRLYWLTAVVHIEREFISPRTLRWMPTDAALARLADDDPPPVDAWTRDVSGGG